MGSFHTVVADVACPECGDRHYVSHQTKFEHSLVAVSTRLRLGAD